MKRTLLSLLTFYVILFLFNADIVRAGESYVSFRPVGNASCLADGDRAATVYADTADWKGVLMAAGKQTVCIGILPTQDVMPARGLRLAYGVDDETPITMDARQGLHDEFREYTPANLKASPTLKPLPPRNNSLALLKGNRFCRNEVFDNLRWLVTEFDVAEPGLHTFKIYMVDPEIVLEQLVFNPDNVHPSYFGAVPVRHE